MLLQLLATFLASLAYVLQKKAHITTTDGSSIYRSPLWAIGIACLIGNALVDVYSFSLMDQAKLAAFGAVTMAWNVLLSSVVLKEAFTKYDGAAVVVISYGTILALWASQAASKDFTFDEIVGLLDDGAVYIYSIVVGSAAILSAVYIERFSKVQPTQWSSTQQWAMAVGL